MSPYLRAGVIAAIVTLVLDQASKLWLLFVFDIAASRRGEGHAVLRPGAGLECRNQLRLAAVRQPPIAQVGLMAVKAVAVVVLAIWMARSRTLLATVALGLIIGGAVGNGIDRFAMAPWSISPFSISRSPEIASIGTCLTLPTWRLLPGWRPYCMIPSLGYPPQKRPDPGRYGLSLLSGWPTPAFRGNLNRKSAMRETEVSFRLLQNSSLTRALRFAALALGIGLVMATGPVRADDDEDDDKTFEEKIIEGIMAGIGGTNMENSGIDYRERSPLVVPPKIDLPPPPAPGRGEGAELAEGSGRAAPQGRIAARKKENKDPVAARPHPDAGRTRSRQDRAAARTSTTRSSPALRHQPDPEPVAARL